MICYISAESSGTKNCNYNKLDCIYVHVIGVAQWRDFYFVIYELFLSEFV